MYYRLKTVDFDGYIEYFNIESINYTQHKSFVIYPNPVVDNRVNFQLNFNANAGSEIRATDLTGIEVFRYQIQESGDQFAAPLLLDPGTYIFRIKSAEFSEVKRIVVK